MPPTGDDPGGRPVDPRDRVVVAFDDNGGTFVETARHTRGSVVMFYGDVELSIELDALFA